MEGGERRQHRRGDRGGRHRQRHQLHPSRYADAPGRQAEIHQGRHGAKIAALGYGKYYTDKVPFGFSYVGEDDINNRQVTHGLHVSGIVAANGDEENGGVAGVAPDAQLFAMQVFGSTGSGFNDDIIRAWRIP